MGKGGEDGGGGSGAATQPVNTPTHAHTCVIEQIRAAPLACILALAACFAIHIRTGPHALAGSFVFIVRLFVGCVVVLLPLVSVVAL